MTWLALAAIYAGLMTFYWLWTVRRLRRLSHGGTRLSGVRCGEDIAWPRLSVVVPACNEQDDLEPALKTLLESDYPDLELVVVDDRSGDSTGAVIERLAAGDGRIRPVHISELPEGWMGKPHALAQGLRRATGRYVLFTDADVHMKPSTFRQAVALCLERRLDHLTVMPELWGGGLLLRSIIVLFLRSFLLAVKPWAAGDPRSKAYVGVGAFNLVRREAFESAGGFEAIRLEVADDMGVGLIMKRSGGRCGAAGGEGLVGLHWYRDLGSAVRGSEKGYANVCQFSLLRTVLIVTACLLIESSPILAMIPAALAPAQPIAWVGLAVVGAFLLAAGATRAVFKGPLVPILIGPLTALLVAAIFIRTYIVGRRRGGIVWRGTLYPTQMLRGRMKVRWP